MNKNKIVEISGIKHCGDGGDEAICNCNSNEHFKCASGQCTDKSYQCDGGKKMTH